MHLDNANPRSGFTDGKDKDITEDPRNGYTNSTISKDNSRNCNICNTRYNNKNEYNDSDEHKENVNQKKLVDGKWRDKVNELRLDHNMKYNQIMITSSNYKDITFLNVLEEMYNIHPISSLAHLM